MKYDYELRYYCPLTFKTIRRRFDRLKDARREYSRLIGLMRYPSVWRIEYREQRVSWNGRPR